MKAVSGTTISFATNTTRNKLQERHAKPKFRPVVNMKNQREKNGNTKNPMDQY